MSLPAPVLRVALTGGIATGKSHCLRRFAELGALVIDADVVTRALVAPGQPALRAILERFGDTVRASDGTLDRAALGRIVFADPAARGDLERLLHPRVYAAIREWFRTLAPGAGSSRAIAVADIPLLYETGHHTDFDRVIVAICQPAEQLRRLMKRDGLSVEEARQRIAAQDPMESKAARADYVIETTGTIAETDRQVERIWRALSKTDDD